MEYSYLIIGALGAIILANHVAAIKKLGPDTVNREAINITRLEQIQGIDINALSICRQKGLI